MKILTSGALAIRLLSTGALVMTLAGCAADKHAVGDEPPILVGQASPIDPKDTQSVTQPVPSTNGPHQIYIVADTTRKISPRTLYARVVGDNKVEIVFSTFETPIGNAKKGAGAGAKP